MNKAGIIIFLIIILTFNCKKTETNNNTQNETEIEIPDFNESSNINFDAMEKILKESSTLNTEVFFAIAVLSKRYILQFENTTSDMTEEKQQKFYEEKKNEFFNSIKFSENEYNNFMQNYPEKLIEFQNDHPAIMDYLTTIN